MSKTNIVYNVNDRPGWAKTLIFAFQQVLAILAATIVVPVIINNDLSLNDAGIFPQMSQSAALLGAGVGTIIYLLFTKFRSPVFLGSSFAFLGAMTAPFAGALSMIGGYIGLIIGAVMAGLVYVVIALIVKFVGTNWIDKVMPVAVIGPTVAIIGLSLAGNAVGDLTKSPVSTCSPYVALICGLATLVTVIVCSVYGKKMMKMIPFIIGILAGYFVALIFTLIGKLTGSAELLVIDFDLFNNMQWLPSFTFVEGIKGINEVGDWGAYLITIFAAYVPVAFVVFAEHLADHKNISSIIGNDLTKDPGLHRTLLGDGVGSMVGAFFGGCPNTTYGESVGCIAISKNASVVTIFTAAVICILAAFVAPFVTFLATIPNCVMGGVCFTLYGFIAVSGLKMIQKVDLGDNRNLFVVSVILIAGIGGLKLEIGGVTLTSVACALILGIIVNIIVNIKTKKNEPTVEDKTEIE